MDYKKFGVVMDFTAYIGTAVEKANDSIRIFHNYKKISTVKFKKEAIVEMDKLLDQAPDEAKAEFNHYKQEYLTNAII